MDATNSPSAQRGMSIVPWIVLALVAAAVFIYALMRGGGEGASGTSAQGVGHPLPFLRLQGLTGDGQDVALDDLAGRVTLINYWGTWCPPCQREFPHIVELAEKFHNQPDFRLYAVSCDGGTDNDVDELGKQTAMFLESHNVSLPTYADPGAASRKAMIVSLGLDGFGFPTTLVLDRQGIIRGLWIGYEPGSERAMQSLVEELLDKLPSTVR